MNGLSLAHSLRVQCPGREVMEAEAEGSWSHCRRYDKADNEECYSSTYFVIFIQSGTSVHGLMLPPAKAALPIPINPMSINLNDHTQKLAS